MSTDPVLPAPPPGPSKPDHGHTLSVNHDDLEYFANTILPSYLSQLETDPGYSAMLGFSGQGTAAKDHHYVALLAGNFDGGTNLQKGFAHLAGSVVGDFKIFHNQMEKARLDVLDFLKTMDTAHDEALTAAEVMQILQDVIGAGGGGGGGGGGK
ncbi:hypothetical protein P3T27_004541 [Kitasatospora sp. MAA19]|uniref:hypothetical protein n=1 Tax=unclassified Kitasatospora TaxID=2633591 RepID=UPI002475C534|nr:hypothetical protein [Kitasatospora sp. MAA19]MDH6707804.1 hypothetical protein [Kitasatospora sp. MAA19]